MDGRRLGSAPAAGAPAARPALEVLFMSGRREMSGEAEIPGPMIEKPFGVDLLAAKLRQVLDGSGQAAAG